VALDGEEIDCSHSSGGGIIKGRHIEPTHSPWNTPIFVIRKKLGIWRLLQDLRAVNKVMQPMGALQPGLPSPTAIPLNYCLCILDLKDAFFTHPYPFKRQRKNRSHFIIAKSSGPWAPISLDSAAPRLG
jgi:hypothetical protein